jgi:hypothetical protein
VSEHIADTAPNSSEKLRQTLKVTEEEQEIDLIRHDAVAILRLGYPPLLF